MNNNMSLSPQQPAGPMVMGSDVPSALSNMPTTDVASVSSSNSSFSKLSTTSKLDVDTALAKELHKLSVQDRNKVQEEVHGVQFAVPEESPQMIETAMQCLQTEIQKIKGKPAYDYAMRSSQLDTTFIQSTEFKLRFLRAVLYDAKQAAGRYIRHLNLLQEFFGDAALQRPLQLSDLSKVERDCIKEGRRQILPSRDRSGRLIMFEKGSNPSDSRTTRIRVRLYVWSVIAEDEETQKKGVVGIAELREDVFADITNSETRSAYKAILYSLPVRFSAVHLILNFPDGPIYNLIKSAVILGLFGSEERVRTKCYDGMTTETSYALMSFGIPVQEIPLTSGGNLKTKNLIQWMKTRKAIDTFRRGGVSVWNIIMHPNTHDVLFSRGGNAQHLGNKDFHQCLAVMNASYHSSLQRDDTERIRNELIQSVSSQNGRFLQVNKDGGWWEEITDLESVHFKINNAFYDYNRKLKAVQYQQTSKSATLNFLEPNKRRKIGDGDGKKGCFNGLF